jgi:hypothetical protein
LARWILNMTEKMVWFDPAWPMTFMPLESYLKGAFDSFAGVITSDFHFWNTWLFTPTSSTLLL